MNYPDERVLLIQDSMSAHVTDGINFAEEYPLTIDRDTILQDKNAPKKNVFALNTASTHTQSGREKLKRFDPKNQDNGIAKRDSTTNDSPNKRVRV